MLSLTFTTCIPLHQFYNSDSDTLTLFHTELVKNTFFLTFAELSPLIVLAYFFYLDDNNVLFRAKAGWVSPLQHPVLKEIAADYGKSVGQVALRYQIERGLTLTAKSSNPKRLRENLDVSRTGFMIYISLYV